MKFIHLSKKYEKFEFDIGRLRYRKGLHLSIN